MSWIRSILSYLIFALATPWLVGHRRLRRGIRQRLGLSSPKWPPRQKDAQAPRIWLHGASAGDILALVPTAQALKIRYPAAQLLATTLTDSGLTMAQAHVPLFDCIGYAPYDLPHATRGAMRKMRPDVLVLEYTELWPQLIDAAGRTNVAVVMHNGRFSKARLGRYRLLFFVCGNLLRRFSILLMRDPEEAERATNLGAAPQTVVTTGNTKFDNVPAIPDEARVEAVRNACGVGSGQPVWVAGSTHEGEEKPLLDVFLALKKKWPALVLILAPRYRERGEQLLTLARHFNLRAVLRSRFVNDSQQAHDVCVLDTIGELVACYALADVVFVGGSFTLRGGQNILEPAACGKAVIFGPNMQNFSDSVKVLLGRGGIQVASYVQLQRVLEDLLTAPQSAKELGLMAQQQLGVSRGAAARNAAHIAAVMSPAVCRV